MIPHVVVQLLSFGALGLSAYLAYLSYRLLEAEQKRTNVREPMLAAADRYRTSMIFFLFLAGVLWLVQLFIQSPETSRDDKHVVALNGEIEQLKKGKRIDNLTAKSLEDYGK